MQEIFFDDDDDFNQVKEKEVFQQKQEVQKVVAYQNVFNSEIQIEKNEQRKKSEQEFLINQNDQQEQIQVKQKELSDLQERNIDIKNESFKKNDNLEKSDLEQNKSRNENEIIIKVLDPIVKDSVKNFVIYKIKGKDNLGIFDEERRYSDFRLLRNCLIQFWPGCYICDLPEKKLVGNLNYKFIEERRIHLEQFLLNLCQQKHLWYSEPVQVFLKEKEADLEKKIQGLINYQNFEQIAKRLKENFFDQRFEKEIDSEEMIKVENFSQFLIRSKPLLKNYAGIMKNLVKQKKFYSDQIQILMEIILPQYENKNLSYYAQQNQKKLLISKTSQEKIDLAEKLKIKFEQNEFQLFYQQIKTEARQVSAFIETLNTRNYYENLKNKSIKKKEELAIQLTKLISNKNNKNKNEQNTIQEAIEKENKILEYISQITKIITHHLNLNEIPKFKNNRTLEYYQIIKKIAQSEIQFNTLIFQYWQIIYQDPNLNELKFEFLKF